MRPKSVSNWTPKTPTEELCCSKVLKPNANDNKDSLAPESPYKQALGGSGKPSGPFGPRGRGF
jgi:hypothetical protein